MILLFYFLPVVFTQLETKTHTIDPISNIPVPEPGYQCRPQPLDVVFLIDGSRSIRPSNFEVIKQYVKETIPGLAPFSSKDTQIGVIQFGSIVRSEFKLNATYSLPSMHRKIDAIKQMKAGTMIGAAIRRMMRKTLTDRYGGRESNKNVKRVGIIITDGRSQDRMNVLDWASIAKTNNVTLYTIGIGRAVNKTELTLIASEPSYKHFFFSQDFDAFKEVSIGLKPYVCFDLNECEAKVHNCEQLCVNSEGSYSCECRWGFKLHTDKRSCTKINACAESKCEHTCHALNGTVDGYLCSCDDGYVLQPDKISCKPHIPVPPRQVKVDQYGKDFINVSWTMTNIYDIKSYQVTYYLKKYPDDKFSILVHNPGQTQVSITGLESNSVYGIEIRSMTRFAISEPITFQAETAPYDFKAWIVDASESEVRIGLSGGYTVSPEKILGFLVKYKPSEASTEFQKTQLFDPHSTELYLNNLIPNVDYTFTVSERVPVEDSNIPNAYRLESNQYLSATTKPKSHDNFIKTVKTSALIIGWEAAPGNPSTYQVEIFNEHYGNQKMTVDGTVTEIEIEDLIPGQMYQVSVEPNYRFFKGSAVPRYFSTQYKDPEKPTVVDQHESTVHLQWSKPPGPVSKYLISYEDGVNNKELAVLPPQTSVIVNNLTPGNDYQFSLATLYNGLSYVSKPTTATTKEFQPSVALENQSNSELRISWEPAPGPVTGYLLTYSASVSTEIKQVELMANQTSYVLKRLLPGMEYEIAVAAQYGNKYHQASVMNVNTLSQSDWKIKVIKSTADKIALNWTTIDSAEVKGYTIKYEEDISGYNQKIELSRNSNSTVISNLNPATDYRISLFAKIGKSGSSSIPMAVTKSQTLPLPPHNTRITHTTDDSITIEWTQPANGYDEYMAICEPVLNSEAVKGLIDKGKRVVVTVGNKAICEDLLPAHDYKIGLKSKFDDQFSEEINVDVATKAPRPSTVDVADPTNDSVNLIVGPPLRGEVEHYIVEVQSYKPEDEGLIIFFTQIHCDQFT